jgi:dTMP kinase
MTLRNFVVLEGGDGTGTSTQLNILKERLAKTKRAPHYSIGFEPTEGSIGSMIRLALRGESPLQPETVAACSRRTGGNTSTRREASSNGLSGGNW